MTLYTSALSPVLQNKVAVTHYDLSDAESRQADRENGDAAAKNCNLQSVPSKLNDSWMRKGFIFKMPRSGLKPKIRYLIIIVSLNRLILIFKT